MTDMATNWLDLIRFKSTTLCGAIFRTMLLYQMAVKIGGMVAIGGMGWKMSTTRSAATVGP